MTIRNRPINARLLCGAAAIAILASSGAARAAEANYDIPPQSLDNALREFGVQSGVTILADAAVTFAKQSPGISATAEPEAALRKILDGTGLAYRREGDVFVVAQQGEGGSGPQSASAGGDVDALIVTAQKREENIQDVPIAISAFSQEDLTRSQVAGGPDLMTQVPNMTFTKTNFTGYSIQIRGIGTQAISATTDAAVAVAFNNTSFIRNRFFEQEFYDLQRVEVLRGPQGTLYGRNATAGVVNIISAKPKFGYEARLSADVANYNSTRLEGMLNIPLVDDVVALRLAGAWTKREGFVENQITGNPIDGRDLWSTRLSLRFAPTDALDVNLIWEHFEEKDDRLRSGKQLCHQDDRTQIGDLRVGLRGYSNLFSQGCLAASLYSPDSFEAPDGFSLPYYLPLKELGVPVKAGFNPYASLVQSSDLRVIESSVDPKYEADSDLVQLQWSYDIGNSLTLTSETAYQHDALFSLEDYNRFSTTAGAFNLDGNLSSRGRFMQEGPNGEAIFCDPQVGCSDRVLAVDVSTAKSSQFSQEFRLSSDYEGPFNFSLGGNFLRYDTEDKYYVFINTLTMMAVAGATGGGATSPWRPGVTDNGECLTQGFVTPDPNTFLPLSGCMYIDPNPIGSINDLGHNYFLSRNPYKLISYAMFGEAYYDVTENLKLTAGLRWTVDKKEAPRLPSWLIGAHTVGTSRLAVEEQEWREPTGRVTLDWKPDLSFTDETLLYASYAHGYKAGGSNPPPSGVVIWSEEGDVANGLVDQSVAKPKIFDAEFVDAFELGAKNTLLDGALTVNLAAFYYDYTGYQVSQIIDRSAVNYNFDAKIWGLELEADWRPLENLRLGFKGGYEKTKIADGEHAIDIMDRTAGRTDWLVLRPFPSFPSNCVMPAAVFDLFRNNVAVYGGQIFEGGSMGPCEYAYTIGLDPATLRPYEPDPTLAEGFYGAGLIRQISDLGWVDYHGYDPDLEVGQNHGEGFFKELGGNELPNAPHFTATITADYTLPLPSDWLMTLHTDLYYQSEAWTRVFNTEGYDKLKAYSNINLAAIFTNEDAGWKVMAYVKNVLDRDSITGAFLNSDDTGLTTNVFLTEPRLYGVRFTKDFDGGPWWTGANPDHPAGEPYPLTIELGGGALRQDAPYETLGASFDGTFSDAIDPNATQHRDLDWGDARSARVTYRPAGSAYSLMAGFRSLQSNGGLHRLHGSETAGELRCPYPLQFLPDPAWCEVGGFLYDARSAGLNWSDSTTREKEESSFVDFAVGRDVELGLLAGGRSTFSAGFRYAQFQSKTGITKNGVPDMELEDGFSIGNKYPALYHHYRAEMEADRKFEGAGPALSWDAARKLYGNEAGGHLDLDWSMTGGVLFGKRRTTVTGIEEGAYFDTVGYVNILSGVFQPLDPIPFNVPERNKSVSAPFVDLSVGFSYEIQRVKVGAGYRWERYFDVLDAGFETEKDYDRTQDGPYFKVSVGFGG